MPSAKDIAKKVLDRMRLIEVPEPDMFQDGVMLEAYKKIFNYKNIEQILPSGDKMISEARRVLDERQLSVLVEAVNHGVFSRERLPAIIARITRGWNRGPATPDLRILKLISMQNTGKLGQKFAEKRQKDAKNNKNDIEIEENSGKAYEFQGKYASIEDLGIENGFSNKFLDRLKEMNDEYKLEIADRAVLRLLVSSEIHLENMMARQCRAFSAKRLVQIERMLQIVKNCLETLKLTRRQRRVENDDTTEKDIEKKYAENRNLKRDIDPEEQSVVNRSKQAILEFAQETAVDEDDYELCPNCLSTECDGSCEDEKEEE